MRFVGLGGKILLGVVSRDCLLLLPLLSLLLTGCCCWAGDEEAVFVERKWLVMVARMMAKSMFHSFPFLTTNVVHKLHSTRCILILKVH